MFPDNDFLGWFFTYFTGDVTCPHCQAIIYQDEVGESGDDYIVCPYCGEEICKDDLET